ncbi:unnamed protein product [Symbiodinium sp. CCMP2592]|nr:unnamed protein product [Symbiodinium sp. CCMP2592]
MPRPVGSCERHLTKEELELLQQNIVLPPDELLEIKKDATSIFARCSTPKEVSSHKRILVFAPLALLERHHWVLGPIVKMVPEGPLLELLMYGLLKGCTTAELPADSILLLAQDVKVMLQTLRKYRRQWLWLAKKTNVDWPPGASKYPRVFSMVKDMTGDLAKPDGDEDECNDSEEITSEAQELAAMWAVPDTDGVEEQILKKRKTALEELQQTTVLLHGSSDEEQPPEAARSSRDPAPISAPPRGPGASQNAAPMPGPPREPDAYTPEPESLEAIAWYMGVKPPDAVDLVQQRRLVAEARAKGKAKAKAKAKANASRAHYRLKFQNRKGVEMPSLYDNEENKQILQLSTKIYPDATEKVREWVRQLNEDETDVAAVLYECNEIKAARS